MALDTYANLKTAVASWLNKTNLTASVPDFIALAEAQMNRELDCREMVATTTLTISDEEYGLPCDFAGVQSFRIDGSPAEPLTYVLPHELDDAIGTGKPTRYTITDCFVFDPVPDGEYEARLRYRKRLPSLSDTCQTNWLLRKHPDAYLYGALMQAAPFLRDDDRIATWGGLFKAAIDSINADDKRTAQPSTVNSRGRSF